MQSMAHNRAFRRLHLFECLLLVAGLLMSAQAAQAFFAEATDPSSSRTLVSSDGCVPECSGDCSYTELENGQECGFGCGCCGCETYQAQLGIWRTVGGMCLQDSGGGCECSGGSWQWLGTYLGTTARTTSDC